MPLGTDAIKDDFSDVAQTVGEGEEDGDGSPENDVETDEDDVVQEPDGPDDLGFGDEDIDDAFGEDEEDGEEGEETPPSDDNDGDEIEEDGDQDTEEEGGEEESEDDETVRVVDAVASQFGLDPEEDFDGELDDTFDDVVKTARRGAEKMAHKEMNNFFEKYPDIREYTEYRVNGGDPDTYREEVLNAPSYEELELEGNESTQERVVREKLKEVEGLSDDRVDDRVERYKSAGILKSEAEDAREIMSEKQEERREQLVEQQKKEAEKRKQEQLERQKEYKQKIEESSSLGGLQLPEDQKDDFQEYLFEPVNEEGHTQAQLDYQEMNQEQALSMYYLMFQGGPENLGKLVDNKASTKKADRLSDKLKKTSNRDVNDKSRKSNSQKRRSDDPNLEGFDLDSAIG